MEIDLELHVVSEIPDKLVHENKALEFSFPILPENLSRFGREKNGQLFFPRKLFSALDRWTGKVIAKMGNLNF